jgi:hypothetical protein
VLSYHPPVFEFNIHPQEILLNKNIYYVKLFMSLHIISESSQKNKRFFVHQFELNENKKWSGRIKRSEVNASDFKLRSHAYQPNDLLLELVVPFKIFHDESRHFMLLPGFENQDNYLKSLTHSALKSAATCLVVFYKQKYATQANQDLISYINKSFSDSKPIFLLSWTDMEPDSNASLCTQVRADLNLEATTSRIIPVGKNSIDWHNTLKKALSENARSTDKFQKIQIDNIKSITDEGNKLNSDIKSFLDIESVHQNVKEYESVERVLKYIENEIVDLREKFSNGLNITLGRYFQTAESAMNKILGEEDNYLWERVKDIFRNPISVQNKLEKQIKEAIGKDNKTTIEEAAAIAMNKILNDKCSQYNFATLPESIELDIPREIVIAGDSQENLQTKLLNKEIISDLKIIFCEKPGEFSERLEHSIKLIPTISLEAMRIRMISPHMFDDQSLLEDRFKSSYTTTSIVEHYQKNRYEFALGIGILFGMDVIPDGQFNLFGLLHANTQPTASGAAVASATASWVMGSIVAVAAIMYGIHEAQKDMVRRANIAHRAYTDMKEYVVNNYLCSYDTYMNTIKDIVTERLRVKYNIPERFAEIQNLYGTIEDNRKSIKRIKEELIAFEPRVAI